MKKFLIGLLLYFLVSQAYAVTIAFSAASSNGSEAVTTKTLVVALSEASASTITATYALTGTATNNTDYAITPESISILPGATTTSLTIIVTNDTLDEVNETAIVTIDTASGATIGATAAHTYTINDDDDPPVMSFTDVSTTGSEATATCRMVIQLSAVSAKNTTATYSRSGTATLDSDYTTATASIAINAGSTTTSLVFTVTNDTTYELPETIIATLTAAANATLGTTDTQTYTIIENDAAPTVALAATADSGYETVTTYSLTLTQSAASEADTTVTYALTGTATCGDDYTTGSAVFYIPAGQTVASTTMTIVNDAIFEPNKTIHIALDEYQNASAGDVTTHTYTILDNDPTALNGGYFNSCTSGHVEITKVDLTDYIIYNISWHTLDTETVTFTSDNINGRLIQVTTIPGNSPTDDYDLYIKQFGVDLAGANLDNRDTATPETYSFIAAPVLLVGQWQFSIANAGTSKNGNVLLFMEK